MATFTFLQQIYTAPNCVTLVRPACTLPFVLCIRHVQNADAPWARWGALSFFAIIAASDVLDGWLARRLRQESSLGRTLDHLCDVVFILTALGNFATYGLVPWWLPGAIAWSFGLYAFDSWWRTAGQQQRRLLGSRAGHLGGILYYVAVGGVTGNLCAGNSLFPAALLPGSFVGLTLLASLSGVERLYFFASDFSRPSPARPTARSIRRSSRSTP